MLPLPLALEEEGGVRGRSPESDLPHINIDPGAICRTSGITDCPVSVYRHVNMMRQ